MTTAKRKEKSFHLGDEDGSIHASNPGRIKMATKILVDNRYGLMDDLNFASHTTTGGTVSYTHLDVYKRQSYNLLVSTLLLKQ